ncbi:MAG: AraC family transcriptional regulator [Peptococcaceae bacterium BRH_c4a]|nr:MAG: AraC family transcriptional regulator [Peptococcaceae bacterium BRH_c4a]
MNIETESKEGRILTNVIEVLDDFATTIKEMEEAHDQLENYLESIDEDLFHLEEDVYNDEAEASEEGEYLEVDCPRCGEVVCFESDVLEDEDTIEVTCPNCDEVVFVNDDTFQAADEPEPIEGKRVTEDDL